MTSEQPELPLWRMAFYAMPALPVAFLYLPMPIMIPAFYSQHLGLSLTVIGTFLFCAKLFDFIIDPMLGRLSDLTRSRWGRRRPWMVAGAPIMMIGTVMLFIPPDAVSGWYLMGATMTVYLGASMLGLAYSAWGAEVVTTYHGRARLAGFREAAALAGTLIAASIPAVTATMGHGMDRFTMSFVAWGLVLLTPPTLFLALRFVPDSGVAPPAQAEPPLGAMFRQIMVNRPLRMLCLGFFSINVAVAVTNSTLVFFITYWLGQEALIGPILIASFAAVLLFVPVWVRISRSIGKHRAAGLSLLFAVIGSAIFAFLLQPGDGLWFIGLMACLGAISAAFLALPVGIMGDIIDYDELKNGSPRGGVFFGVWAFIQQVAPAVGVGITLPLLNWLGFDPSNPAETNRIEAVRYVYCFGPLPFYLLGAAALLAFPIDARRHAIIRRRLDGRRRRSALSEQELVYAGATGGGALASAAPPALAEER